MSDTKVMTGALAIVRSGGKPCGLLRSIVATENIQRGSVQGLGTVYDSEAPVVKVDCSLTCEFMEIDFTSSGVPNAIKRDFTNVLSQVVSAGTSLEDNLVLDSDGVQIDIFKKVEDVLNPDGTIKPKLNPYATCYNCFITSDSFNISEGSVSGHSQSFKYLKSISAALLATP